MKASIADELDAFVEEWREDTDTKHNNVVGAALLLFFEQDLDSQIELLKKARNHDLDKLQARRAASAGVAVQVVEKAHEKAVPPSSSRKPRQKTAAES